VTGMAFDEVLVSERGGQFRPPTWSFSFWSSPDAASVRITHVNDGIERM
jgi:hypothetical protein